LATVPSLSLAVAVSAIVAGAVHPPGADAARVTAGG
jgi:hypothetical protein